MSGLRAIAAIPLRGVVPAQPGKDLPRFEWVEPQSLFVESEYQRDIVAKGIGLIRRVVAGWNWARIKPPVCVKAGGKLVVIDGQHTAIAAASHGAVKKIPVMIVCADSVKERASAFIGQNRDRLTLTPMHMHYAAAAAGEEIALAVQEACKKAGASVVRCSRGRDGTYRIGETFAVGVIARLVARIGVHHTAKILKVVVDARRAPLTADEISAVAALLYEPEYKGKFEASDIATALRSRTVARWRAIAGDYVSKGATRRRALAQAIADHLRRAR